MPSYDKHYYDGAWQASTGAETIAVVSSATEQEFARVPRGTAADVDAAVKAARRGFESLSRVGDEERAQWLEKLDEAMNTRASKKAVEFDPDVVTELVCATNVTVEHPIMLLDMIY